jgi:hypothetical protein
MEVLGLTLAFILELIAFIGFAALGLLAPVPRLAQLGLCLILLSGLLVFWGRYMAPRAPKPFSLNAYYFAKALVYAPAAFMLDKLYSHDTGIIFATAALLNEAALYKHNATRLRKAN